MGRTAMIGLAIAALSYGSRAESTPEVEAETNSIYDAVFSGEGERIRELLKDTPVLVHARDGLKRTPLHVAARNGKLDVVDLLIEKGADVNAVAYNGFTPLHLAREHPKVAECLLKHGADMTVRDNFGDTPLQNAAYHKNKAFVDVLLAHGDSLDFRSAISLGMTGKVEEFLKKDPGLVNAAVVQTQFSRGTALHLAAHQGHVEIVKLLLKCGADVNRRARWSGGTNTTPLYLARGNIPVMRVLLENGADPNIRFTMAHAGRNMLLLDFAERNKDRASAELLKEHGAKGSSKP